MRIAVLTYGRLNKCAEHYPNTLDSIGKDNNIDFFLSSDNSSESLLNDFIRLYKPISYNNTPITYNYDLGNYPNRLPVVNIHHMTCHMINKNRVLSLLEEYIHKENIHYDVVISLRIDCVFHNKFIFNDLLDNIIYIPDGFDYLPYAINDQIAYGKIDVMKKYNSINPLDLLDKKLSIPHPESLNYANIHFHKLIVRRVNLCYHLER